jgi:hypothetical protein
VLDFVSERRRNKRVDVNNDTHQRHCAKSEKEHIENAVSNALQGNGSKKRNVNHSAGKEAVEQPDGKKRLVTFVFKLFSQR